MEEEEEEEAAARCGGGCCGWGEVEARSSDRLKNDKYMNLLSVALWCEFLLL